MSFKVRRCLTTVVVFSVLILMQFAVDGYAARGTKIAFTSTRIDGFGEIYVMNGDGGNQARLTNHPAQERGASWSPDGARIAYDESPQLWPSQIYVVEADGGGRTKRLTDDSPTKRNPVWSPDGETIAYAAWERDVSGTIDLITTDGKRLNQLGEAHAFSDDPDWFDPRAWSVSPDANVITTWGEIKRPKSARR